jgi:hypothetical protein
MAGRAKVRFIDTRVRMNVGTEREGSIGLGREAFCTDGDGLSTTMSQSGQADRIIVVSSLRDREPTLSNIFS